MHRAFERSIQLDELHRGFSPLRADDDPIGFQCISDCRSLSEELRVAYHVEEVVRNAAISNDPFDETTAAYWHGRLVDDHRIGFDTAGNRTGHALNGRQVRAAVGSRRSANSDEDDLRIRDCGFDRVSESNVPFLERTLEDFLEARLINRRDPSPKLSQFPLILVDADYLVAHVG